MHDPLFVGLLTAFFVMILVLFAVGVRYGDVVNEEATGGEQSKA